MKYKAVGFDYTGVISGDSAKKFHEKVSSVLGVSYPDFRQVYLKYNLLFNSGKMPKEIFWKTILKDLKKTEFYEQLMGVVDAPRELNTGMIDLLREIKSKGYKVGVLSNDTKEGAKIIREKGNLKNIADLILVSAETGFAKPTKEAFLDFSDKLGVKPEEVVFIDDAQANIDAAKGIGFSVIKCDEISNLRDQLRELNIL